MAKSSGGSCYKLALEHVLNHKDATLVHGIVTGQCEIEGVRYGHAWVEFRHNGLDIVFDPSIDKAFPKDLYYSIGEIEYTKRYTLDEALLILTEQQHYGPWDNKIKKSVHG